MEKDHNKAHVLLLPFPAQGHINPILQFAKRLASKNVRATVAITRSVSKTLPSDPTHNLLRIDTISDGFDTGGYTESESPEAYSERFHQIGSKTLSQLIVKLAGSGHPVTALVFDPVVPWAIDVAEEFGLVKVAFFTQTCAVSSVYYHVNKGHLELPLSGDGVVSLPGLPPLRPYEVPSFVADPEAYPLYFSIFVGQFDKIHEVDWVLESTFYELESEVIDWMSKLWRLRTVGPMIPSMYLDKRIQDDTQYGINIYNPNTTICNNWLSQRSPGSVVYVSFGSMASPDADQIEEVARALKQSGYYFLWVVREVDQNKLPDKFKEETSDKGLVVTWCPQLEVLSGGRVGCFVTHCGLSSTMEALSLGVPVVAVPQWTDQCTNAKFAEDVWGIGIRALIRGELEARIREVMEGERGKVVKKNAMKWMSLARQAMEIGGSSDKNIDEFVACLGL